MLLNHLLYFYLLHYYNLLCLFFFWHEWIFLFCIFHLSSVFDQSRTTMLDSYDVSETLNNFIKTLGSFCESLDLSVLCCGFLSGMTLLTQLSPKSMEAEVLYTSDMCYPLYISALREAIRVKGNVRHPQRGDWESVSGSVPLIHTRGWVGIRQRWEGAGQRGQKTD